MTTVVDPRATKYRQAAFTYLHVAILYEAAAYAMWRRNLLPPTRLGPPLLWLILGGVVAATVVVIMLRWHNPWFVRVIWVIHGLRLPSLVRGAFFGPADAIIPASFYLTAIVIVVINLWMLARAGWDL